MLLATQLLLSFKQQIFLSSQEDDELFEDYANSGFWDLKMLLGANNDIWVDRFMSLLKNIYLYKEILNFKGLILWALISMVLFLKVAQKLTNLRKIGKMAYKTALSPNPVA